MRLLFLLTIISICIASVWSIKCYDCDSLRDPRCNEYFYAEGVQQTDCDDAEMPKYLHKYGHRIEATGCLTKFHEGVEGFRYFIRRACYFGNLDNTREACEAEDPYLPFADILECHVCEEDLCNTDGAYLPKPSFYIIFALSLSVILTKISN